MFVINLLIINLFNIDLFNRSTKQILDGQFIQNLWDVTTLTLLKLGKGTEVT